MFNYPEMKLALYWLETILGTLLLAASVVWMDAATKSAEPLVYFLPAAVVFLMGLTCLLFGFETFLFREDPDIWR